MRRHDVAAWPNGSIPTPLGTTPAPAIPDWPYPGMGPLAGIAAALVILGGGWLSADRALSPRDQTA